MAWRCDLEEYYRAGTLSGALINVSTAVSQKEFENEATDNAIKPGAQSVEKAKADAKAEIAGVPIGPNQTITRLHAKEPVIVQPPPPTGFILHPIGFERGISLSQGIAIQKALCVSPADGDFGGLSSKTRKAIAQFKAGLKNIAQDAVNAEDGKIKNGKEFNDLRAAVSLKGTCKFQGLNDAFAIGEFIGKKQQ